MFAWLMLQQGDQGRQKKRFENRGTTLRHAAVASTQIRHNISAKVNEALIRPEHVDVRPDKDRHANTQTCQLRIFSRTH